MKKNSGFTLVELLITIVIVGVLLTVGIPSLKTFMKGNQLVASTNEMVSAFNVARSEAIKRNASVTVCESANGTTCTSPATGSWESGWIVFVGAVGSSTGAACTAGNVGTSCLLRSHAAIDNQITISAENVGTSAVVGSTTFNARGLPRTVGGATQTAKFNVCSLDDSGATISSRAMMLNLTGRVRISDNAAVITLCP
jgi:type IV fimbrial biogenesis protein FimT